MGTESFREMQFNGESKEKSERTKVFESLQKLTIGQEDKQGIELEKLDNERYKEMLYRTVENRLDETVNALGINVDSVLLEKLNQAENEKEKTEAQKELIQSLVKQINSIPAGKWAFYPNEIEKQKKINCSGSALICGHILNKLGIDTEYGNPAGHAMNFAKLADGSLEYVDGRIGIVKDIKTEEEEIEGVKVRKINEKNIPFKLIPIFSQRDSILAMLGNIESLKVSAERGDPEAAEIYESNRSLFDITNYQILSEELYPEAGRLLRNEKWQDEEKRVKILYEKFLRKMEEKKKV